MRSAEEWLAAYGESHQHPTNKVLHWVCVPTIMLSLLGLLVSVPSPFSSHWLNWGTALVALTTVFYALLSIRLAVGMALVGSALLVFAMFGLAKLPVALWQASLALFAVAWVGQFVGHAIEGKKPSFFQDIQFLLIGPMWLLAALYRKVGVSF